MSQFRKKNSLRSETKRKEICFACISRFQLKYSLQISRFYSIFSHQIFHIKQNCNFLLTSFHFSFFVSSIFHFASSFIFNSLLIVHFAFIFFMFRLHANKVKKIASVSLLFENERRILLLEGGEGRNDGSPHKDPYRNAQHLLTANIGGTATCRSPP